MVEELKVMLRYEGKKGKSGRAGRVFKAYNVVGERWEGNKGW